MKVNQNGFSIVEVLIASAMLGGIALVVGQLSKNSSQVVRRATNSTEINEAVNRIQKYMLHGESCLLTLSQTGVLQDEEEKEIFTIKRKDASGGDRDVFTKNQPIGKSSKISLNKIEVKRVDGKYIEMRVEFDRDPDPNKENIIAKTIELNALYNGSNVLQKCYSQMDNAVSTAETNACEHLGGTLSPSGQCDIPTSECGPRKVLTSWSPNGGKVCTPISDLLDSNNSTPLYRDVHGNIGTIGPPPGATTSNGKCKISSKRCSRVSSHTCGTSCGGGYTATWNGGRYDEKEGMWNYRCMRRYRCVPNTPIGSLVK